MRLARRAAVSALLLLSLTGCWNRTELNELGITAATGVDRTDGGWSLSYQVIVPSAMWSGFGGGTGSTPQAPVHVYSSEGRTVSEAAGKSSLELPRRLYFSHTDVLVVGKRAAEQGIREVIDLYLRSFDSRETVQVLVTEGPAGDILKQFVPTEKLPGTALSRILNEEQRNSGLIPAVRMFDMARSLYSDANAIVVPEIRLSVEDGGDARQLESTGASRIPRPPRS